LQFFSGRFMRCCKTDIFLLRQLAQWLHFDRCLTTEYSETTAHCNGNVDNDNQLYVS
jgi:hypothetical protein